MASDGIKEPVHHPHLTTNIYLSCQDNDVSKLVDVVDGNGKDGTVKDDPPQHRLAACTCLQQGSTCLCAGRNSPRCAGRRNLINRHSHSHLYVFSKPDRLFHREHRACCEGRPPLPCFVGCSLAPHGSTGELSCQT